MEILLSKLIALFIYPVGLLFCLLLVTAVLLFAGKLRAARLLLIAAILVMFAGGNHWTAYTLVRSLENDYRPVPVEETPEADVIVVLGGGLGVPSPPRLHADLNGSADRLLHAVRLYRAGKAEHILLSGGNVFPQPGLEATSYYSKQLLVFWGVPDSAVVIETESRNTIQNAEHTAPILEQKGWNKVLLVTSASHMSRAELAFDRAGVAVTPVPVDFTAVDDSEPAILQWIPSAGALGGTAKALHEYVGRLWYWLRM